MEIKQDLSNSATPLNQPTEHSQRVYNVAKGCLGKHITEDPNVDPALGCAEAISHVLDEAGYDLGSHGIAGTSELYTWLKNHFTPVTDPLPGDVLISPTGTSTKGSPHGHVAIVAKYGILSNSSTTGKFSENFTLDSWKQYYSNLGFPMFFFRAK